MMARAGSRQPFKEAKEDLLVYAGIEVSAKDVERVAEKIGDHIEIWQMLNGKHYCRLRPRLRAAKSIPVLYVEMDGTGVPMVRSEKTDERASNLTVRQRHVRSNSDVSLRKPPQTKTAARLETPVQQVSSAL